MLRQDLTEAEKELWGLLRGRRIDGLKFRRQHPLKNYIVDFFCYELELVVELDGGYHNFPEQKEKDELRDLHLKALGYKVLRFSNDTVFKNPKEVIESIYEYSIIYKKKNNAPLSVGRGAGGEGKTVLSTKKLTPSQKNLILGAGFSVVEYDAIKIEPLDFKLPEELKNLIFTSKNGVYAFLERNHISPEKTNCFCVGSKTEGLLKEKGFHVIKTAQNASELSDFIVKNYQKEHFTFFCSAIRRKELPEKLTENLVSFEEIIAYKTQLNTKTFNREFDAVLFFSPSGVESFTSVNTLKNTLAVCIGQTTANEVQKHTEHFTVANATTVESVIARAVKALN
ncbi:uroporphyrinogen-III synthase [Leeuwenhoekiella polynyae]|uniref:Uroporphyrinogen-III synthase n=1 Tax=Leeuwenhoekiella polynyae TaxID=1550906 RepID=A0A4Q0PHE0_9FLAO|nr:uroporphyrinogen-III synthase [Leeuwenhoekiella polynyae]